MRTISIAEIDPDFTTAINEVMRQPHTKDSFYVNICENREDVFDYNFTVSGDPVSFQCDNHPGSQFQVKNDNLFTAVLDGKSFSFKEASTKGIMGRGASNFLSVGVIDVDSVQYVTGDFFGNVEVCDASRQSVRSFINVHAGPVMHTRFFPSGKVILTGSNDMRLKILSIEDGSNPRTFVGHTSRITGTAIIGRGRNILSSAADGTIRLWECGSGSNIHTFVRRENSTDSVSAIALIPGSGNINPTSSRNMEYGTEGNIVLGGYYTGVVTAFDVFTKQEVMQFPNQFMASCSSLCVDSDDQNYVYAGYGDGTVAMWDRRSPNKSLEEVTLGDGLVPSGLMHMNGKLVISGNTERNILVDVDRAKRKFDTQNPCFLSSSGQFLSLASYTDKKGTSVLFGVGFEETFHEYKF